MHKLGICILGVCVCLDIIKMSQAAKRSFRMEPYRPEILSLLYTCCCAAVYPFYNQSLIGGTLWNLTSTFCMYRYWILTDAQYTLLGPTDDNLILCALILRSTVENKTQQNKQVYEKSANPMQRASKISIKQTETELHYV